MLFQALDMTENERQNFDQQKQLVLYAICHACGMLSACANPIIYGFLNENFKAEFKDLYQIVKSRICCCKCFNRANNNNQNNQELDPGAEGNGVQQTIEMAPLVSHKEILHNTNKPWWRCVFFKSSETPNSANHKSSKRASIEVNHV